MVDLPTKVQTGRRFAARGPSLEGPSAQDPSQVPPRLSPTSHSLRHPMGPK